MSHDIELDAQEARVLGVLIEKSLTTPDQYPLSLNAVTLGCNQKSNRNPVLSLADSEVHSTLSRLMLHHLTGAVHPTGSRVEKYRHNALESFGIEPGQAAVLAELLLRGPQSQGELRPRVDRMSKTPDLGLLQRLIDPLIEKGLVGRLGPTPGSRAERFVQLIAPDLHELDAEPTTATQTTATPTPQGPPLGERVTQLEARVEELSRQLTTLAEKLGEPLD